MILTDDMMNLSGKEKSLSQKIADEIITYIIDNNLKTGEKLPNEQALSELLGAGRSSIREAMKQLETRNIVDIRQGSGTYVSEKKGVLDDPFGLIFVNDKKKLAKDMLEVRFMIEPKVAALAASNSTDEEVEELKKVCERVEKLIRNGEDHTLEDINMHTIIARNSHNIIVPRLIPVINSSIKLFISLTDRSLKDETIMSHREIVNAIAAHDETAAHDAMYLHLVYNRRRIAELIKNSNFCNSQK